MSLCQFHIPRQWYFKLELEYDRIPITAHKYEDLSEVDHGPKLGSSANRWLKTGRLCSAAPTDEET